MSTSCLANLISIVPSLHRIAVAALSFVQNVIRSFCYLPPFTFNIVKYLLKLFQLRYELYCMLFYIICKAVFIFIQVIHKISHFVDKLHNMFYNILNR